MKDAVSNSTKQVSELQIPVRRPAVALIGAMVFLLTFAAFLPALNNQFLNWDDDINFTLNPHFRGLGWEQIHWMFTSFHAGHFQPMTWLTLGWDCIWGGTVFGEHPEYGAGMDPRAFHITNNLLHAVNAVLVYLLALRLLGMAMMNSMQARTWPLCIAAAIAALLFSLHPMRVENVAWITERRDLVSALLLLLTVLAYLRAVRLHDSQRWRWMIVALLLYALSMMAKVAGAPLPFVLLALDWYPLKRLWKNQKHWAHGVLIEKLLFLTVALIFAFIAARGQAVNNWLFSYEVHPMGARILVMNYGLMFYAWKTALPFDLLPLYELRIPMNTAEARFTLAPLFVGASGILIFVLLFTKRWKGLVVAGLCYAALLGPVLGLFQNGPQLVADRYSYLPSIGLMIAVAGGGVWWLKHRSMGKGMYLGTLGVACVTVAVLGALTWSQSKVWRTSETLWEYTLSKDSTSAVANNGYALALLHERNDPAQAAIYFRRAVEHDPMSKSYRANLRFALRSAGRMQEVLAVWIDEARFGQFDARFHAIAGVEALKSQENQLALEHLAVSLALNETQPEVHNNLALILGRLNRNDEAITHYRRSIALDPQLPNPRYGLAHMLSKTGKTAEAIAELQALLAIAPNHANGRNLLTQLQRGSP